MTDRVKLDLIGTFVSHYYEFMGSTDDAKNLAALEAVVDIIDTIISYEDSNDTLDGSACSCSGECHNCLE